jgi:glycosyltransferase involved in cell wall biosynthesis
MTAPLPNVRVYGRLRTAHLERFRQMEPARVLYLRTRYDYDTSEVDPANPPLQLSRSGILWELLRRHHGVVDINEPSMVDRWIFLLLQVAAVRIRSAVARRRTIIAAYCMANADPALEVRVRYRLPPSVCRAITKAMLRLIVSACDRLAFATPASLEMYEAYVGTRRLKHRARLFEAIPAACGCLAEQASGRQARRVVFVGGFLEHKGIREAMAAWDVVSARESDACFTVIGKGRLQTEVEIWAAERPSVELIIDPPRPVIHEALRSSGVLVLLSQRAGHWREQIGLPIQEGLGHGCEIVTTSETGLAGWLQAHEHEVVAPTASPDDVADALLAAMRRAEKRTGSLADLPAEDQRIVADRWMMAPPGPGRHQPRHD